MKPDKDLEAYWNRRLEDYGLPSELPPLRRDTDAESIPSPERDWTPYAPVIEFERHRQLRSLARLALTAREFTVYLLLAEGLTRLDIRNVMRIGAPRVSAIEKNILRKLKKRIRE